MAEFEAKVGFLGMQETSVAASVSVADGHLAIEVSGRTVGRWPIEDLSPRRSGDSVIVFAEGERLVIDVTDPDELRISLRLPDSATATPSASHSVESDGSGAAGPLRDDIHDLRTALASAQAQLRWVQDLMPRRLPIPLRGDESGLGVVQGVRLKERRPLPGSDGLQPWVLVDSGNVYVTTMRLVFSGAQDVEFEFDEINKKGALRTGLLLGVSSRIQAHILEGPGERLAVVLTAAEKLAQGLDPTVPFREAINRLTSQIAETTGRSESVAPTPAAVRLAFDG